MPIQWFPGHMNAARRAAAKTMASVDVVVEVVDARLPEASSNPMIHDLRRRRQRPCLKLLNKADLADPKATQAWLTYYNREPGITAAALCAKKPGDVAAVPALCQSLAPHRHDSIKPLRVMIMGIPNVGKSTLLNALVKRRVAAVGDEPAVTKSQQAIEISPRLSFIDTPGLLWPKIERHEDGLMLAASHAVGRNAMDPETVAIYLAGLLQHRYPDSLATRYELALDELDAAGIVEAIARKRGCLKKGGKPDFEKASSILLVLH